MILDPDELARLRLECLKLAQLNLGVGATAEVVARAKAFADFVLGADQKDGADA